MPNLDGLRQTLALSDREGCSASASGLGVGIADLEGGSDQLFREIDLRSGEEGQARLVDREPRPVPFDEDIVRIRPGGETEAVGEARASPADHFQSEEGAFRLTRADPSDAPRRTLAEPDGSVRSVCRGGVRRHGHDRT